MLLSVGVESTRRIDGCEAVVLGPGSTAYLKGTIVTLGMQGVVTSTENMSSRTFSSRKVKVSTSAHPPTSLASMYIISNHTFFAYFFFLTLVGRVAYTRG
jgi:hypothetical protein